MKENEQKQATIVQKEAVIDGDIAHNQKEFEERVVEINRVSRTVKGGRRIRFRATVLVGNKNGKVGLGIGKAAEVQVAVQKATSQAKKHLVTVPIKDGTILCAVESHHGSAKVIFRPAGEGTSIIAGGAIRPVLELAGIKNVLSKSLGSSNKINNILATFNAFAKMESIQKADR